MRFSGSNGFRADGGVKHQVGVCGPRACGGEYPPRFQLSEVRLAEEFGVNRDTVRNATRSLREKGWITTTPALGSFVADERPRG
ncbi:GntR family transcriptional regulator [Streptomyces acidiscabies]|uniref:GntR family transcriptional regulator n=1 Tax=Streptomyces acidiscabies TaxID=42234 RepID=UPI0029A7B10A|nr:GntR family transcriptional regulator [Streptomyces acidiscabies]MDX3797133.1 GntR family transcriptional regulator [Streptomyces acidiscabies]